MDIILDIVSNTVINQNTKQRPKVCLTWAQSLDGKLSMRSSSPTIISGNQAMQMTHALRALHQTILVGIGTLLSDDPRLTCRMDVATRAIVDKIISASAADRMNEIASSESLTFSHDPIPVILDSSLRTPFDARLLHARSDPKCARPFLFHHSDINHSVNVHLLRQLVQEVQVPLAENTKPSRPCLDLHVVLYELRKRGIMNVMVEGGASVISSFLDTGLWDMVVVTVSAQLFRGGVALPAIETKSRLKPTQFCNSKWIQLGNDIIFIGFPCNQEN